ncbi:MAG: DUF3108 domain-containing protein [Chitinivibrionales bacterium]|nr:DUF3108 domain-containing protein [Chitinivibrionales bacterium]
MGTSRFFSWMPLLAMIVNLTSIFAANVDYKWRDAEPETDILAYTHEYRDSLYNGFGVTFQQGMRTFTTGKFLDNEVLVFEGSWGFMSAGWAKLVLDRDTTNSRLLISAKAMTNPFVSAFYKVRDYMYCIADLEGMYPFFFEEHLREGRYADDRWILFDNQNQLVYTHKKNKRKVEVPPFSHSVMTLLYAIRARELKPGNRFTINAFVQKKNYPIRFTCRCKDRVTTDAGEFDCIMIEPQLVGKGRVFTKKDKIRMYFTDDEYHMPVQVKIKIAVGSIYIKLIHYERP